MPARKSTTRKPTTRGMRAHRKIVREVCAALAESLVAKEVDQFRTRCLESDALAVLFAEAADLGAEAVWAAAAAYAEQRKPQQGGGGRPMKPEYILAAVLRVRLASLGSEACHRLAAALAGDVLGVTVSQAQVAARLRDRRSEEKARARTGT